MYLYIITILLIFALGLALYWLLWAIFFHPPIKIIRLSRYVFKVIAPFFRHIQHECNAKYPILMEEISPDSFGLMPKDSNKVCIFFQDYKVVIQNILTGATCIEIPVVDVDQFSFSISDYPRQSFSMHIYFSVPDITKLCNISFETSTYKMIRRAYGDTYFVEDLIQAIKSESLTRELYRCYIDKVFLSFFNAMQDEYNAEYPIAATITSSTLPDLPADNKTPFCMFFSDDKIIVKSVLDTKTHLEIPFDCIHSIYRFSESTRIEYCIDDISYELRFKAFPLSPENKEAFGKQYFATEFLQKLNSLEN